MVLPPLQLVPTPNGRPPRRSRRLLTLFAILALVGAASAALWLQARQSSEIFVAITSWPGYEYFYLAEQKELAQALGLDLRVKQYSSLADQRLAYVRGDVNVIATTLPEAIALCQEVPARCPLLVLVLDESVGADRLIARVDLATPAALAGQQVGLERTVLAEYLLLRSLEGQSVGVADLKLRFDGPTALVSGLRTGDLDAIVTYSPHDLPLRQDERFHELFSSSQLPGEVVDVLAVDPEVARLRRSALETLVRSWWAAQAYAKANRSEAVAVMAQRQQISPIAFAQSEQGLRFPSAEQQHDLLEENGPVARAIARMAALLVEAQRIQPDAPLPRPTTSFLVEP
jgi:NitT/TauT family transport system substrate-binding protein